jgi:hypothetical protein
MDFPEKGLLMGFWSGVLAIILLFGGISVGGELEELLNQQLNSNPSTFQNSPSNWNPEQEKGGEGERGEGERGWGGGVEGSIVITGWGEFNPIGGFADGHYTLVRVEYKPAPKPGWKEAILIFEKRKGIFGYQLEKSLWLREHTEGVEVFDPEEGRTYFVEFSSSRKLVIDEPRNHIVLFFHY